MFPEGKNGCHLLGGSELKHTLLHRHHCDCLDPGLELRLPSARMLLTHCQESNNLFYSRTGLRYFNTSEVRDLQEIRERERKLTGSREPCHGDRKLISCSMGSRYTHLWLLSAATLPINLPSPKYSFKRCDIDATELRSSTTRRTT